MEVGSSASSFVFAYFPVLMIIFYLFLLGLGFFVLYLTIKIAINNSKLNYNIEQLRIEVSRLNNNLLSMSDSKITENSKEK
ncbi:hypothetical protein SAMN02799630_03317 [Paenibacillus sp. UNCCL117]|nr:hypothetical protein SAMN04488602_112132 [Paenibacillus sp. cl123]SFW45762.1 hypothetical protein SAMN02799630_03317 [Paenibacillus sp. UNCCL117]